MSFYSSILTPQGCGRGREGGRRRPLVYDGGVANQGVERGFVDSLSSSLPSHLTPVHVLHCTGEPACLTCSELCGEQEAQSYIEIAQLSCLLAWDLGRISLSEPVYSAPKQGHSSRVVVRMSGGEEHYGSGTGLALVVSIMVVGWCSNSGMDCSPSLHVWWPVPGPNKARIISPF